jgi:hypothetical protein
MSQYFGKYRGTVDSNADPKNLGRIKVKVPAVLHDSATSWATPCVPYAGNQVGFFAIPPVGAHIWVEFEGGDPNKAIWVGCYWKDGEIPINPAVADVKVFKTKNIMLKLDDTDDTGGVTLEVNSPSVSDPLKMIFDSNGITIDCDPSFIKLKQGRIEINHSPVKVLLTKNILQLSNKNKVFAKLSAEDISLTFDPVKFTLTSEDIELKNKTASLKLSKGIEMKCDSVVAKVKKDGIDLEHGSKKINISSSSVSINGGALEVT